jgi:hypothetical protein
MSLPAEEILVIAPLQESSHAVVSRRYIACREHEEREPQRE